MLIAEDLLLLLTDDDSGKLVVSGSTVDMALAGANLIELTLLERVDLTAQGDGGKPGRIVVRSSDPTGDSLLDDALARLGDKAGKKPSTAIGPLAKGVRRSLQDRLVERGILRHEEGRILGIFPTRSWPAADETHERELREQVAFSLRREAATDDRVGAVIALLHALKSTHKVIAPATVGLTRRDLDARAKQIAEGSWGSAAVRQAVDEMMAAVMVATMAATTAATAGG